MTTTTVSPDQELRELRAERDALRAQLEGDLPRATAWLQWKVWRQRTALDALERRVLSQRRVLRALDERSRGLTRAEWLEVRAALPDELRERTLEEV